LKRQHTDAKELFPVQFIEAQPFIHRAKNSGEICHSKARHLKHLLRKCLFCGARFENAFFLDFVACAKLPRSASSRWITQFKREEFKLENDHQI
jgi:hypothetical protein